MVNYKKTGGFYKVSEFQGFLRDSDQVMDLSGDEQRAVGVWISNVIARLLYADFTIFLLPVTIVSGISWTNQQDRWSTFELQVSSRVDKKKESFQLLTWRRVCATLTKSSSLTCDDKTIELHVLPHIVQWSGLAVDHNNINAITSYFKAFLSQTMLKLIFQSFIFVNKPTSTTTHLLDSLHNTRGHSSSEKMSFLPQVERSSCCSEPNLPSFTPLH